MTWQKTRIEIPDNIPPADRVAVANDILQRIQQRAINENKGFNPDTGREKKFPGYSSAYAKKKGSSKNDVDLILSGAMFTDMDLLSHQKGSLLLGFENGSKSNAKAEGNQLGSYGGSPSASKARPSLGISIKDLEEILERHGYKRRS